MNKEDLNSISTLSLHHKIELLKSMIINANDVKNETVIYLWDILNDSKRTITEINEIISIGTEQLKDLEIEYNKRVTKFR